MVEPMQKTDNRYLSSKLRIFEALLLRFVIGRYGRDNIGFMWTFAEPLLLCVGVMVIWSFTKGRSEHGLDLVAVVFTGYMPLTLWRHQTGLVVNILRSVKFLTMFKNVRLFDILVTKLFYEFVSVTGSTLIVFIALLSLDLLNQPHDMLLMLQGWLIMGLLGTSFGFLVASASEMSELVEKIMPPLQYFILPLCGCFYMVDWLPDSVKLYALYVPTVHSYEMIRAGYFGPSLKTHFEYTYPLMVSLLTAGVGCYIFNQIKDNVEG